MKYSSTLFFILVLILTVTGCTLFKKSAAPLPKPEMVYVEGGIFLMGDIAGTENGDALPVHTVLMNDYYMSKYEVTVSQFNAYAKRNHRKDTLEDSLKFDARAVSGVTWNEAKAYCNYFGYRLPTEPEWEYAARSGGKKQRFSGTGNPDSLYKYGHADLNNINNPLPVGLKKPNTLGLYDMSGNVFEWVGKYYQLYPKNGKAPNWDDMDERIMRVIRGGSYDQPAQVASTYWRAGMLHDSQATDVGFRCAADDI